MAVPMLSPATVAAGRRANTTRALACGLLVATPAALLCGAGNAHASTSSSIRSPSGDVACNLYEGNGFGSVYCDVVGQTWSPPTVPANCRFPHGPVFVLEQRRDDPRPPLIDQCGPGNAGINLQPDLQTLDYGQARSVGAITCDSEPIGLTCTDASSGHSFQLSRDSYALS